MERIKEGINDLSPEQQNHFAWLCGVRVLPFLGGYRRFEYWEEKKQIHLNSIFFALDILVAYNKGITTDPIQKEVAFNATYDASVHASISKGMAACSTINVFSLLVKGSVSEAVNVINSVISSSRSVYKGKCNIPANIIVKFQDIILSDIKAIYNNKPETLCNDTTIYGGLWDIFLADLNQVGCDYWARLYADLFKNRFELDETELDNRLCVPSEIRDNGVAAVGQHLDDIRGFGTQNLDEVRIIILGPQGAGKTSLARRLRDMNAKMPTKKETTMGVLTDIWEVPTHDGKNIIKVHIWDFAGHTITHSAHRFFMSSRCLYIYVHDGRIDNSGDYHYWLDQISMYGGNYSPSIFLSNRKNKYRPEIPEGKIKAKYPFLDNNGEAGNFHSVNIGYTNTNNRHNKDKQEFEAFQKVVMDMVRNNPSWTTQRMSSYGYKIKEALHKRFQTNNNDYITDECFRSIFESNYKRSEEESRAPELIMKYILDELKTLGICLWYEELKNIGKFILNPDWITHGIYTILNIARENNGKCIKKKHFITVDEGHVILQKDMRYDFSLEDVKFLFHLMRLYELAYFKNDEGTHICVPGIMSLDEPKELSEFEKKLPGFGTTQNLRMDFEVTTALPSNIVPRLIVLRHTHNKREVFDENMLWREGAVLKYSTDTYAVIKEDREQKRITVNVYGDENTQYISSLRTTLSSIFEVYKGIDMEIKYRLLLDTNDIYADKIIDKIMCPERVIISRSTEENPPPELYTGKNIKYSQTLEKYNINSGIGIFCHDAKEVKEGLRILAEALRARGEEKWAEEVDERVSVLDNIRLMNLNSSNDPSATPRNTTTKEQKDYLHKFSEWLQSGAADVYDTAILAGGVIVTVYKLTTLIEFTTRVISMI